MNMQERTFAQDALDNHISGEVMSTNQARASALQGKATATGLTLLDIDVEYSIVNKNAVEQQMDLVVYEWTWITYKANGAVASDEMGFGTIHNITVEKIDDSWIIQKDVYNESDILGTATLADIENQNAGTGTNQKQQIDRSEFYVENQIQPQVYSNYNANAAVDYADTWVVHEYSTTMQNTSYYNTSMYGYYSNDCANYVSQCLKAGGMPFDYGSGKSNTNFDGTQWWFDVNPSPAYDNYNVSPPSWRKVSRFALYWQNEGYSIVNATNSTVYPGNPAYYLRNDANDTGQVTICVGYNSAGAPIMNGHNRDVYHVPLSWVSESGYQLKTIKINTSNIFVDTPATAYNFGTPTTTVATVGTYIDPQESRYYKFTVSQADTYTMYSTYYSTNSLDTRAYLYKESVPSSSGPSVLAMYEIRSDDDSGDGLNFRISEYLQPGTYYLRVRPRYMTASPGGSWINIKRGQ